MISLSWEKMKESKYVRWAKQFETCQRWFDRLSVKKSGSKGTEERYSRALFDFHKSSGITPDDFVAEWRKASKEDLEQALEDFDVKLDMFLKWLKEGRGLSKSTGATHHAALKSLIKYNCRIKLAIGTPSSGIPRSYKPLTIDEVKRLDAIGNIQQKWIIRGLKDSGMSRADFSELTYGDVAKELEADEQFIHLNVIRRKEEVEHDTFLGPNAVKALKDYLEWRKRRGEVITPKSPLTATYSRPFKKIRPDVITIMLNRLGKQLGIKASPHRLRKTFDTYMALTVRHPIVLKYWMGHKLASDIEAKYIIPPVPEQMRIYMEGYKNIDIEQVSMEERVKAVEEVLESIPPEQRELMKKHGITMMRKEKTETNGAGLSEQKIVSEAELARYLKQSWRVITALPSGNVVIER